MKTFSETVFEQNDGGFDDNRKVKICTEKNFNFQVLFDENAGDERFQ